jgi:pimeloyl-ACP methyl ester carboxylesterase
MIEKLVLRLFFAPVGYNLNSDEKSLLDRGGKFSINVNNRMIQCWQWGDGPVVILAHGWNGRGIQFQPFIEALLDANYSVITFDAPGHGDSEGHYSNYFEFSDALRALWHAIDHTNVQAIIGHSLGAGALLNFMSKEKYYKKAVLIAPALRLRELLFQTFEDHHIPKRVYLNLVQNLEMVHGYSIFNDNPAQLIKQIKNNVLIFHDRNDKAVPYEHTKCAAERIALITLETTIGLGHKRILSDTSVMEKTIGYIEGKKSSQRKIQKAS